MATAAEHMQADMDWLFSQDGGSVQDVDLTIAGSLLSAVRAVVIPLDTDPAAYEGAAVSRVELRLQAGAIPAVPPGREVVFDGIKWQCESFRPSGLVVALTLMRYQG